MLRRRLTLPLVLLAALALTGSGAAAASPGGRTSPFIVGGAPSAGAFPWTARLAIGTNGVAYGQCSGSLIGDRWVLTAAHCVSDLQGPQPSALIPGLSVSVSVPGPGDGPGDTVDATTVDVYPGWDPATLRDDIALLLLARPVSAQAIPLLRPDQAALAAAGAAGVTAGWGVLDPGGAGSATGLRAAALPVISDAGCAAAYPGGGDEIVYDAGAMLCAGTLAGGAGTCFGDSGGPLMVSDGAGGYLLAGSTSWGGVPCASAGNPSVFTRMSAFTPGIVRLVGASAEAPAGPATALTGAPADVGPGSATLTGSVDPGGLATDYRLEIGTTAAYGTVVSHGYVGAGHGATAIALPVAGLTPGVTYHYRLVAENAAGIARGADMLLGAPAPTVAQAVSGGASPRPSTFHDRVGKAARCSRLTGPRRATCLRRQRRVAALHRRRRAAAARACARLPTARRAHCRAVALRRR